MKKHKIAVIVGSLRKESYNLKTAKAMMAMAPESFNMELLDIAGLPMFNEEGRIFQVVLFMIIV